MPEIWQLSLLKKKKTKVERSQNKSKRHLSSNLPVAVYYF